MPGMAARATMAPGDDPVAHQHLLNAHLMRRVAFRTHVSRAGRFGLITREQRLRILERTLEAPQV